MNERNQPASPTGTSRRAIPKPPANAISSAAVETGTQPRTIHPYPNKVTWCSGTVSLGRQANLTLAYDADPGAIEMMKETWRQFTLGAIDLVVTHDATLTTGQFMLDGTRLPQSQPNITYALKVDASGAAATATNPVAARHAWFTLLQLLQTYDSANGGLGVTLPHVEIQDWPALKFRGLHLCVFPETTPLMIEKVIRLAAFLKFTHVVLEFWGMLRFETLKELSWPEAWSKEQASQLFGLARRMGLEIIPMFNGWGHAAASRNRHGRHVVLDQNPRLAPLFEPDGWTWCLTNPHAQALIRSVYDELIELAGPGEYFHIGCDEAYSHATCDRCRQHDRVQLFADHINGLDAHLEKRGRRAMMWGDALLERAKWPFPFAANGIPTLPTHEALDRISRRIVIADWHYDILKGDLPTLAHFRAPGFDVCACPWNSEANIRTLAKAAADNNSGLMMTTWHQLGQSIPLLAWAANCAWSQDHSTLNMSQCNAELMRAATASYLRKLMPAEGHYEHAGWVPFEMRAETL